MHRGEHVAAVDPAGTSYQSVHPLPSAVGPEGHHHGFRKVDVPAAALGLGLEQRQLPLDVGEGVADPEVTPIEVHVVPPQAQQLSLAEARPESEYVDARIVGLATSSSQRRRNGPSFSIGTVDPPLTRDYLGHDVSGDHALISSELYGKARTAWVQATAVSKIRPAPTPARDCSDEIAAERKRFKSAAVAAIEGI